MKSNTPENFDRDKHLYQSEAFVEIVKDAIRFFNGTPVLTLPPPVRFIGTGVYALYYIGENPLYHHYSVANRLAYQEPIYVGKAVPRGWRQSRTISSGLETSSELFGRLNEHSRTISLGANLSPDDFRCRFMIFDADTSDMVSTVEALLIKITKPLWNSCLDGFGNHDPGKGRYQQAKSDWDVIHPGRKWAEKCVGKPKDSEFIISRISTFFGTLKEPNEDS